MQSSRKRNWSISYCTVLKYLHTLFSVSAFQHFYLKRRAFAGLCSLDVISSLHTVLTQSCGSDEWSGTWGQLRRCRLTAEDRKYQDHMCVTDTWGMLRRISCSHLIFVLMSQSPGTFPVALSPACAAYTFWALLMWLPYILVTWWGFTLCMAWTLSYVQVMCFLLHWFMTRSYF